MEQDTINLEEHQKHQEWERDWWGNCSNTFNEEEKQFTYSRLMGLDQFLENDGGRKGWNMGERLVIDIGGGPASMLLKTKASIRVVVDPCHYPNWVGSRYQECGIDYMIGNAEEIQARGTKIFDEVWIYNVLQHVQDPERILKNARQISKIVRIFEWIDVGVSPGHPHNLTEDKLNSWLGGIGKVTQLNENGCRGKAYSGIFKGDHYAE